MASNDYSIILSLLPPALILSVLAYLTRFFGKIIADQQPVVDDRDWFIELGGATFMLSISVGVIGIVQALKAPLSFDNWWLQWLLFSISSLIYVLLALSNATVYRKLYNVYQSKIEKYTPLKKKLYETFFKGSRYVSTGFVSIILFYLATLEYLSGNVLWTVVVEVIIFQALIQLAYNFSLKKMKDIVPVSIYFVDTSVETLKEVIILKQNSDNLRVRDGNKIIIINKSLVARIEMVIPDQIL